MAYKYRRAGRRPGSIENCSSLRPWTREPSDRMALRRARVMAIALPLVAALTLLVVWLMPEIPFWRQPTQRGAARVCGKTVVGAGANAHYSVTLEVVLTDARRLRGDCRVTETEWDRLAINALAQAEYVLSARGTSMRIKRMLPEPALDASP